MDANVTFVTFDFNFFFKNKDEHKHKMALQFDVPKGGSSWHNGSKGTLYR